MSAFAAVALTATPVVANAQSLEKIVFLTNYVFNGRHAPLFVGVDKGFYKAAGFDVTITPATGSGFVITAIDGGKADFGMADFSSVVRGVAKGAGVKAFMVYTDSPTDGLASLKPYPTPQSIVGETIAASETDSVRVILPIIFHNYKLDPSTIKWVAADPSVYFSLLLNGQIDLFTASSDGDMPALTKAAAKQNKSVYFSSFFKWGYDIFGYMLVGSKMMLGKNPEEAERFANATNQAVAYSIAHPEEAARIMVRYNPTMSLDTVETQWKGTIASMERGFQFTGCLMSVSLQHVSKSFGPTVAVENVSLTIAENSFVSIVGPSGCGKSTLLRMTAGLVLPSSGEITVRGTLVKRPMRDIGMVFQTPVLLPWRTTLRNILFVAEMGGRNVAALRRRAIELMELAGLAGFEASYPHELSGGMQQRVSICRAMLLRPPLILMDEPFGALDVITRERMGFALQTLWDERRNTVLFVTHSIAEAVLLSDTVIVMTSRPGRIRDIVPIDLSRPRGVDTLRESRFVELSARVRDGIESQQVD
jgi:ABC-type nitrate/sulfonate/bicarbonate transport system ATPase subunit/ABC-type nitrate/sulfonate/bicarbonate transport system substrate-binding protein